MTDTAGKITALAPAPAPVAANPQPSDGLPSSRPEGTVQRLIGVDGYVESYGQQHAAECLIFCGWVLRRYMACDTWSVTATFQRGSISGVARVAFHERKDLGEQRVGFVALLAGNRGLMGNLLNFAIGPQPLLIARSVLENTHGLSDESVTELAAHFLNSCFEQPHVVQMRNLLERRFIGKGYIDGYGYHAPSIGWFVTGWVSNDWVNAIRPDGAVEVVVHFDTGPYSGPAVFNLFQRPDLQGTGLGIILHFSTDENLSGKLQKLVLISDAVAVIVHMAKVMEPVPADAIFGAFAGLIANSQPGPSRRKLHDHISRVAFDGRDTVRELPVQILMGFDETIRCGESCVILIGWLLAKPETFRTMRLRSGTRAFPIDFETSVLWLERPDVADKLGVEHGFEDRRCGFVMCVPITRLITDELYFEIEAQTGEIGYKPLPRARLDGITAIKRILNCIETQYNDVDSIYDNVLGPAVGTLNAQRLRIPPRVRTVQLGPPVTAPRYSIIVPLYGRIDFMEFQLALFASQKIGTDVEIIYVLDDPPRTRDAQFLAASLYERFRVSFKLLCLSHNLGFAPANNVGVRAASGDYICFMNSDVFPRSGGWLDRLAARLEADPTLGVVGPVLLFEDDSVQHQGISFKNLPQFGGWAFPQHKRKGFRVPADGGLAREEAITGACILMRRADVTAFGAFDEAFIIGDFEDTDLCFRLREHGLGAAVDFDVSMYHLERKSQAGSGSLWRSNLTLYNAWIHQRRWAETIRRSGKAV